MTEENMRGDDSPRAVAPKGRALDYGVGPVLVVGALSVLLIGGLVGALAGGFPANVAANAATSSATPGEEVSSPSVDIDEDEGEGENPKGEPSTLPDRGSDQNEEEVVTPSEPTHEDVIYYIQRGDTLTALSARFGVSVDYFAEYNAIRDVNIINEGAVLRVPYIYIPPEGWTPEQ